MPPAPTTTTQPQAPNHPVGAGYRGLTVIVGGACVEDPPPQLSGSSLCCSSFSLFHAVTLSFSLWVGGTCPLWVIASVLCSSIANGSRLLSTRLHPDQIRAAAGMNSVRRLVPSASRSYLTLDGRQVARLPTSSSRNPVAKMHYDHDYE
jgi:hypothetical protein